MSKDKKIKIGYVLRGYLMFPALFAVVLLIAAVLMFLLVGTKAGVITTALLVIYCIASAVFIMVNNGRVQDGLLKFGKEFQVMEKEFIHDLPFPYAVVDNEGSIILFNEAFLKFSEAPANVNICDIFKELEPGDLIFDGRECDIAMEFKKRSYRLHFSRLAVPDELIDEGIGVSMVGGGYVIAVYVFDDTEIIDLMRANLEQQVIVGSLYIDNYNEVIEQVEDVNRMLVSGMIDKEIFNYFAPMDAILRKVEKDRFFIVFKRKFLPAMQRTKFDLLDNIKSIDTGVDMPVTISMGVGAGDSYHSSQDAAKEALALALGRGGDQVVVKEDDRTYFYGGKTRSVEKNTRVKARVTSIALREILLSKKRVVIMGHKVGDIDCLGAAVGLSKAAKSLGIPAYIVMNEFSNAMQSMLEEFLDDPDYGEGAFVTVEDSPRYVDEDTALIIVDVNNPEHFERRDLILQTKTIVIIDHHLRSDAKIENVAMSYIEPTASSASEMIAELLQYIKADLKLKKLEAEALYAGIMIDTNYFSKNTGVRTFEAAAYLRKFGIDVGRVRSLFSDTLEDYKAKADTISNARFIQDGFAMAVVPEEGLENPTIVAAQVANELLDLSGVRASFVLLDHDGKIYISARSDGSVNVQLIMERMGGGGHMNIAGAQLKGEQVSEAERKLIATVNKMLEEGVI